VVGGDSASSYWKTAIGSCGFAISDFEQRSIDSPYGEGDQLRRLLVLVMAGALTVLGGTTALAGNGGTVQFGPFAGASPDGGTCSPWANDTYARSYTVHDNGDGTFKVTADSRHGTFVTIDGASPGGCEDTNHHGSTVAAGITGGFQGFLSGTVTSSTFDPTGCGLADCSTTQGFLGAVFGLAPYSSAFTCNAGYAGCDFNFEYHSSDSSLQYHSWQDKSDNHGGEQFIGDIANS